MKAGAQRAVLKIVPAGYRNGALIDPPPALGASGGLRKEGFFLKKEAKTFATWPRRGGVSEAKLHITANAYAPGGSPRRRWARCTRMAAVAPQI
jgi:hypothetical protein